MQALSKFAHPADVAGGVADDEGIVGDGFGDDSTGTDEGKPSDIVAADDGGVGSNGGTLLYQGAGIFAFAVDGRARVGYVGEDHRWSEEDIVFADYTGIDADIVLHFHIFAKYHIRANNNVLSDVAIFTNGAVGHDVAEVPDFCSGADVAAGVDDGGFVGEVVCLHWGLGFGVRRLGFGVWRSGFGVWGSAFDVRRLFFKFVSSVC